MKKTILGVAAGGTLALISALAIGQGIQYEGPSKGTVPSVAVTSLPTSTITIAGQDGGYPVGIVGSVTVTGYPGVTLACSQVTCAAGGDGGVLAKTTGTRYVSTSTGNIRVANDTPCTAYSDGTGRILPENSVLDWVALASGVPDAGAGNIGGYTCCAESAGAVWQLCQVP